MKNKKNLDRRNHWAGFVDASVNDMGPMDTYVSISKTKNKFQEIGSYGCHIYQWDS